MRIKENSTGSPLLLNKWMDKPGDLNYEEMKRSKFCKYEKVNNLKSAVNSLEWRRISKSKIVEFIGELEWDAHTICSNCAVSSNGSAMGWDLFQIFFDLDLAGLKFIQTYKRKKGIRLSSNLCSGFQSSL